MSGDPYDWTVAEVEAAWKAYNAAPENATKGELRALMDAARLAPAVGDERLKP